MRINSMKFGWISALVLGAVAVHPIIAGGEPEDGGDAIVGSYFVVMGFQTLNEARLSDDSSCYSTDVEARCDCGGEPSITCANYVIRTSCTSSECTDSQQAYAEFVQLIEDAASVDYLTAFHDNDSRLLIQRIRDDIAAYRETDETEYRFIAIADPNREITFHIVFSSQLLEMFADEF